MKARWIPVRLPWRGLLSATALLTLAPTFSFAEGASCAQVLFEANAADSRSLVADTPAGTVRPWLREGFLGNMGFYLPTPEASLSAFRRQAFRKLLPLDAVGFAKMSGAPFTTTTTYLGTSAEGVPLFTTSHHADVASKPVQVELTSADGQTLSLPLANAALFSSMRSDVSVWTIDPVFLKSADGQMALARLREIQPVRWTSRTIEQIVRDDPHAQFFSTGIVMASAIRKSQATMPDLWPAESAGAWSAPGVSQEETAHTNALNNQGYVKFVMPINNMVAKSAPVIDPDSVRPGNPPPAPGSIRLGPDWQPDTILFNYRNFSGSSGSAVLVFTKGQTYVIATHWGLDAAHDVRDLIRQIKGDAANGTPAQPQLAYPQVDLQADGTYKIVQDADFGMAAATQSIQQEVQKALRDGSLSVETPEGRALQTFFGSIH